LNPVYSSSSQQLAYKQPATSRLYHVAERLKHYDVIGNSSWSVAYFTMFPVGVFAYNAILELYAMLTAKSNSRSLDHRTEALCEWSTISSIYRLKS